MKELGQILAAFSSAGGRMMTGGAQPPPVRGDHPAPGARAQVEPLTARELEILGLLREPLWPKEIARQLQISYQTVRRHTVTIYGKLGVNTRWDAVSRAIELGILPPRWALHARRRHPFLNGSDPAVVWHHPSTPSYTFLHSG